MRKQWIYTHGVHVSGSDWPTHKTLFFLTQMTSYDRSSMGYAPQGYYSGQRRQQQQQHVTMWDWLKTNSRWHTYVDLAKNSGWAESTLEGISAKNISAKNISEYTVLVFEDNAPKARELSSMVNVLETNEASRSAVKEVLNMQLVQGNMIPPLTTALGSSIKSNVRQLHTPIFSTFHVTGAEAIPHRWMVFPTNASGGAPKNFNKLVLVDENNQVKQINVEVSEVLMPSGVRNFNVVVLRDSYLLNA